MTAPQITVLVAAYNQGSYLSQALDSLKAQTLSAQAFEVIVINDGSTDETASVLNKYPWITRRDRENRGLVNTCNEGLQLARGAYFARLDSDDYAAPTWLASLLP